jgi:hypothetical protein
MLNRVPEVVAGGATIGGKIAIAQGFILARAVQGVLRGAQTATGRDEGVLLLSGGVQLPTGRHFDEVAAEVERANDEALYMRTALDHIMAGVQVHEIQAPRGDPSPADNLPPIAGGEPN